MSKKSFLLERRQRVPVQHLTVELYESVIDDTVSRVKGEFVQEGIDESVLDELRALWEQALEKTGVCEKEELEESELEEEEQPSPPRIQAQPATVQPLAQQPQQPRSIPPAAAPQPPRPQVLQSHAQHQQQFLMQQAQLQQRQQQLLQQQQQHQQMMNQFALNQYAMSQNSQGGWGVPGGTAPQQQYQHQQPNAMAMMQQQAAYQQQQQHAQAHAQMQQAQQQQQQQQAYSQASQLQQQPQHQHQQHMSYSQASHASLHHAPDLVMPPQAGPGPGLTIAQLSGQKRQMESPPMGGPPPAKQLHLGAPAATIPQQDGPADDGPAEPSAGAGPSTSLAVAVEDLIGPGDSGDELNEEDDLADVDDHEEINEDSIKDVVLGQFEKVQRSKAKWKINLKNCVATINGRDYLLKKVTGEMNFS